MERAEWLKHIRSTVEGLYDKIAPQYWVNFGLYPDETHQEFIPKFLGLVEEGGAVLSAACGAGRYDGTLLEAGLSVVGIDQSAGMLKQAKEHFPQARYEKMGLQEINFHEAFEGVICMDAMENIGPEDWPVVLRSFQMALKPGGVLYYTVELPEPGVVEASYRRAKALGLPVVYGEVADEIDAAYEQAMAVERPSGEQAAAAVYHFYPSPEQVRAWMEQAGLAILEEGPATTTSTSWREENELKPVPS